MLQRELKKILGWSRGYVELQGSFCRILYIQSKLNLCHQQPQNFLMYIFSLRGGQEQGGPAQEPHSPGERD